VWCNKFSIRLNRKTFYLTSSHEVMKTHFWKPELPGNLNAFNRVYTRQTVGNSLREHRKFTIIRWWTKVQSVTSLPELNTEFTNTIGNFQASEYWIRILTVKCRLSNNWLGQMITPSEWLTPLPSLSLAAESGLGSGNHRQTKTHTHTCIYQPT